MYAHGCACMTTSFVTLLFCFDHELVTWLGLTTPFCTPSRGRNSKAPADLYLTVPTAASNQRSFLHTFLVFGANGEKHRTRVSFVEERSAMVMSWSIVRTCHPSSFSRFANSSLAEVGEWSHSGTLSGFQKHCTYVYLVFVY